MKKLFLLFAVFACVYSASAQISGRLDGLRDAWGTSFDYIGEIKDGKPNGLGIAIYTNDNAIRYTGYFVNGLFEGKGVLLLKSGTFSSGMWKAGKLNGKGATLLSTGDIYIGNLMDGKRNGNGALLYKDKSILLGSFKSDAFDGRCLYVGSGAQTLSDNIYVDGKKNGSGYQYEVGPKTLYEGTWNNGDWVGSSTASYYSFLKKSNFYGEKSDNHVIMGCIDRENNNLLQDSGFFYNMKTNIRYFGYNEKGLLTNGVIVKDSLYFLGKLAGDGAYDYCSVYKPGDFYDEGMYTKDLLSGTNSLSIDIKKNTIYYGGATAGNFSGKGWYSNQYNELYYGSYVDNQFTGDGYIVFKNGKTIKGNFKNGIVQKVTSLTDEKGAAIPLKAKTFNEGLSMVTNEYANNYQAFKLDYADSIEYSLDDYFDTYNSLYAFPKTVETDVILEDFDMYLSYNAIFYKGSTYSEAVTKYNELCKDLSSASLKLKYSSSPVTLSGSAETPAEFTTTISKFELNNYPSLAEYKVYAELRYDNNTYKVSLVAGDVVYNN